MVIQWSSNALFKATMSAEKGWPSVLCLFMLFGMLYWVNVVVIEYNALAKHWENALDNVHLSVRLSVWVLVSTLHAIKLYRTSPCSPLPYKWMVLSGQLVSQRECIAMSVSLWSTLSQRINYSTWNSNLNPDSTWNSNLSLVFNLEFQFQRG